MYEAQETHLHTLTEKQADPDALSPIAETMVAQNIQSLEPLRIYKDIDKQRNLAKSVTAR